MRTRGMECRTQFLRRFFRAAVETLGFNTKGARLSPSRSRPCTALRNKRSVKTYDLGATELYMEPKRSRRDFVQLLFRMLRFLEVFFGDFLAPARKLPAGRRTAEAVALKVTR